MGYKFKQRISKRELTIKQFSGKRFDFDVGIFDDALSRIGAYHEFGTRTIPQRSFLRDWFATEEFSIKQQLLTALAKVYNGATPEEAFVALGQFAVMGIKGRILNKIPPQLAASTLQQKDGPNKEIPLVDRGALIKAIKFRITKK
jgi:hypothetical protein